MSVVKVVTPAELAAKLRSLPDRMEAAMVNGARRAAGRLVVAVVEEIDTNKPFPVADRGMLRQSVQMEPMQDGARVYVAAPYAQIQERGTRPFWAPLAPLVEWAERKGHEDPQGFARAVQASIAERGIRPKRYFRRAVTRWKAEGILSAEIKAALRRAADRA